MESFIFIKFMEKMLEELRQKIINDGYDPWELDVYEKEYTSPNIFSLSLMMKKMTCKGASKFVKHNLSYDATTSRVIFNISFPELYFAIGDAASSISINIIGLDCDVKLKGWISLLELRMVGALILGISEGKLKITSVDLNMELKEIRSQMNVKILNTDWSEAVNNFLRTQMTHGINTSLINRKAEFEAALMSTLNPVLANIF